MTQTKLYEHFTFVNWENTSVFNCSFSQWTIITGWWWEESKNKLTKKKINIFKQKKYTFSRQGKKHTLIHDYKVALAKHTDTLSRWQSRTKRKQNRETSNSEKDSGEAKAAKHTSRRKGRIRLCQGLAEKNKQLEYECN